MKTTMTFVLALVCATSGFCADQLQISTDKNAIQRRAQMNLEKELTTLKQEITNAQKSIKLLEKSPIVNKTALQNHQKYIAKLESAYKFSAERLEEIKDKPAIRMMDASTMLLNSINKKDTKDKLIRDLNYTIKDMKNWTSTDSIISKIELMDKTPDYSTFSKLELDVDLILEQNHLKMSEERLKRMPKNSVDYPSVQNEVKRHKQIINAISEALKTNQEQ